MRCKCLALVPLLAAAGTTPCKHRSAISAQTLDLTFEARDLEFSLLDLLVQAEDLGGAAPDLAGTTDDVRVEESETEIRMKLAADVLFDFDRAEIREKARAALEQVAGIIRQYPRQAVRIDGHTDAKGAEAYNQKLSERRAQSVRSWLVDSEGLTETGFQVQGLGESRPAAPNEKPDGSDDPEGRQKNRRVEIVVMK